MPPRAPKQRPPALSSEQFLRSINIRFDAAYPERIEHFRPTSKSAELIRGLVGLGGSRSLMVIAPYGTGKSIAATYALQLIENRPQAKSTLETIGERLDAVDGELGSFSKKRIRSRKHGLVLTLHGHAPNVAEAVKDASLEAMERLRLGRQARPIRTHAAGTGNDAVKILQLLAGKASQEGIDRITIVWDEFGRHLEGIVAEGKAAGLLDVQLLAEFVNRCDDPPVSMAVLLHRGLLHYAASMPQTVIGEWKKVEGRFIPIQYVDESKELFGLIADVAASRRRSPQPKAAEVKKAAQAARRLGLFNGLRAREIEELLARAYPLEPTTLHLLPRLAARVAQNERTLFGFMHSQQLDRPVTPEDLFDYFATAMQADLGIGGTYKRWVETESARAKAADVPGASLALKTACLLSLGSAGERSSASMSLLKNAVSGYEGRQAPFEALPVLIERSLLLHRKHSDEVAVWHGTDLDLRGRLAGEKSRRRPLFSLISFLEREHPVPVWRPVEYNAAFGVRRFFDGRYHTVESLEEWLARDESSRVLPPTSDGRIFYVLVENQSELDRVQELARCGMEGEQQRLVALPREPLPISDAALELDALLSMSMDRALIESDPLAEAELHQMIDDAGSHLEGLLNVVTRPSALGPRWYYRGEPLVLDSPRALREELSKITAKVFTLTPRIFNEMIVRNKPSAVVVNARKKLVLGILERPGQENLGIVGNFPDSSMFRSVLLNTGLYRPAGDSWTYASPVEIDEPALSEVWGEFKDLFTAPIEGTKDLAGFFEKLQAPPFGVRAGVLPILFAAGLKAFASGIALSRQGEYITDILPSTIEALCRDPNSFELRVLELDKGARSYLERFLLLFGVAWQGQGGRAELIRTCFDALQSWKANLPAGAWTTRSLSEEGRLFRDAVARQTDPVSLLFGHLPRVCNVESRKPKKLLDRIEQHKREMEKVAEFYSDEARRLVIRTIGLAGSDEAQDLREVAKRWSVCFPEDIMASLDGVSKGLLSQTKTSFSSDGKLLKSLATLLAGKPIERWDDSSFAVFERELQSVVRRIEERALAMGTTGVALDSGLVGLAESRLGHMYDQLVKLVGSDDAHRIAIQALETRTVRKRRTTSGGGRNG